MKNFTIAAAVSALLIAGPAYAAPGHSHAHGNHAHHHSHDTEYGEPGDPKKPARTVQIVMRESDGKMLFIPDRLEFRKGEQVKLVLRNNGDLDHEMVLGTHAENLKHAEEMRKNPDMAHDEPNAKRLAPKATGEIFWKFTKAGEFDLSCLIPGHREAGMSGTVVVK